MAEADLSQVTWLLCANEADSLPAVLRSRVTVINVPPFPARNAETLLHSLIRDVAAEHNVATTDLLLLTVEAMRHLAQALRRGRSPRPVVCRRQRLH